MLNQRLLLHMRLLPAWVEVNAVSRPLLTQSEMAGKMGQGRREFFVDALTTFWKKGEVGEAISSLIAARYAIWKYLTNKGKREKLRSHR